MKQKNRRSSSCICKDSPDLNFILFVYFESNQENLSFISRQSPVLMSNNSLMMLPCVTIKYIQWHENGHRYSADHWAGQTGHLVSLSLLDTTRQFLLTSVYLSTKSEQWVLAEQLGLSLQTLDMGAFIICVR